MEPLSKKDFYEVIIDGLIADYDIDTLMTLYQPIIGYTAASLYLTLKAKGSMRSINKLEAHENLLNILGIEPGKFVVARQKLEGSGLLKTYREKGDGFNIYTYLLYSPKTPRSFFDDALLFGYLIKIIGEENAFKLKNIYKKNTSEEKGEDITSTFVEAFDSDLTDRAYSLALKTGNDTIGRAHSNVTITFDFDIFFKELTNISQINPHSIPKKVLNEISRIATLYGVDEKMVANEVNTIYNPNKVPSLRIDTKELANKLLNNCKKPYCSGKKGNEDKAKLSSNTSIAKKVDLMENTSPIEFLRILQHGSNPTNADVRLVDDISREVELSNGVINVLIEYILHKNHNVLSRAFMERMAASLKRENIDNVLDAMNYLNSFNKKKEEKPTIKKEAKIKEDIKVEDNKENPLSDDEEWDNLLKDL